MVGEPELSQLARAHAADIALLRAVRSPADPGAVVASLLRAQAAHTDLQTAGGRCEEAPGVPAAGLGTTS